MSNAELPEHLNQAADAVARYAASQEDTAILHLPDLREVFAAPANQDVKAEQAETPAYDEMSEIELLLNLNWLELAVRENPVLEKYLDNTFPAGYKKENAYLQLYTWNSFKSENQETEQDIANKRILEAQQYQLRQLDARKINVSKAVWAEKASVVMVDEMENQVEALFQSDLEAAHVENDRRAAQARSEVVRQRAVRDIETYRELAGFMAALEQANYSMDDIAAQKPELAVYELRTRLNEWEKNGVLAPKPTEKEVAQAPIALSALKRAFHDHKQKVQPFEPAPVRETVVDQTQEIQAEPDVTQTAGARAYAETANSARITAVTASALKGTVTKRVIIEQKQKV